MKKKYYKIDASKKRLGRLATKIATLLRGKNEPNFSPNKISDNIVIVVNANKVNLSASKEESKRYYRYSGYHGGLKTLEFSKIKKNRPEDLIIYAVSGMLPKNKLQKEYLKNMKVYHGEYDGEIKEIILVDEE